MINNIKGFSHNLIFFVVGAFIWIILKENISLPNFFIGGTLTILSIYITNKYFLTIPYHEKYGFTLKKTIIYLLYLVYSIFISGIKTVFYILSGKVNPKIIKIKTVLKSGFEISLLANSITLTPGTVTVDKKDNDLLVLCIIPSSKKEIVRKYEEILTVGDVTDDN